MLYTMHKSYLLLMFLIYVLAELRPKMNWIEAWIFSLPLKNVPVPHWRLFLYFFSIESPIDKLKALAELSIYAPKTILMSRKIKATL